MNSASDGLFSEHCAACQGRAGCPFAKLPPNAFRRFQAVAKVRLYRRGSTLLQQGNDATGLFIIRSGYVRLFHLTSAGNAMMLGLLAPGETVGLPELIARTRYEVSAEALVHSELEYVARDEFELFLCENLILSLDLLRRLSHRMCKYEALVCEMGSRLPAAERLLRRLQDLSEICGRPTHDGVELRLPLSVQDLADSIGCSRQWTSGALHSLKAQGLILWKRDQITLTSQALISKSAIGESQ